MKNRSKNGGLNYRKTQRSELKKVGNVFKYSVGGNISTKDKVAYEHPAIFPEKLVYDQLITWTNKGDIIYDPFMGSGTTAKVAKLYGRHYIGSEISKKYCDIIDKRLKQAT